MDLSREKIVYGFKQITRFLFQQALTQILANHNNSILSSTQTREGITSAEWVFYVQGIPLRATRSPYLLHTVPNPYLPVDGRPETSSALP
jgi:hypothetical protein